MITTLDDDTRAPRLGREGYALLLVLMVLLSVGILAAGAATVAGNAGLINAYESRRTELETLADAGLEVARARLNANPALYPETGYTTLEAGTTPVDATGAPIPGVRRYTYAGPVGQTSGQYGVFGSIISVVESANSRVVRRGDVSQESFAKFAYFTDVEPANISFGGGDVISGPVHSNDKIKIYSSGATFRGPGTVTTAKVVEGEEFGTFTEGYDEQVARIELPTVADLEKLRGYAASGGTVFDSPNGGQTYESRLRIEFVNYDLNGDGRRDGENEGFFRVYIGQGDVDYINAIRPGNDQGWVSSRNCGYWTGNGAGRAFIPMAAMGGNQSTKLSRLRDGSARCYLGGSDSLTNGFRADDAGNNGGWVRRGFGLTSAPAALAGLPDFEFLFPLSRTLNPNFKGVIHVSGKVAISGVVRGRVTLAATGNILIADDVVYASAGNGCEDILGLFSGGDIAVVDNLLNTAQRPPESASFRSYDSTPSEFVNGVLLTLNTFHVQNFGDGPVNAELCESVWFGRGCLFLTGGIIQRTRGAVGTSGGTGYLKRYTYDACAYSDPPPYFPTTGHFARSRYYEINPVGFSPGSFFDRMTPGG
jgi:type II secretory pathway pseudopilin PulG